MVTRIRPPWTYSVQVVTTYWPSLFDFGCGEDERTLRAVPAGYSIQPSCLMAQPAFQILVMWLILPSSKSIT
jgi:hypothetical protein